MTLPTGTELPEAQQAVLAAVHEFCDARDDLDRARNDFDFHGLAAAIQREKAADKALRDARRHMVALRDAKGGA